MSAHAMPEIEVLVLLLAVTAAAAVVASRLKIPEAIVLVLTGLALALVPGLPPVALAPRLVLLLVLPPVIYSAAVAMSWREFRFNLRPIALLAVGCVVFTSIAVAAAAHFLIGLPWPVGFVLGAIVSPPDAVAPLAVARRLQIPRRILVVLEGEGLANDATALILYRFAVAAVSLPLFSLERAAGIFVAIAAGEIAWGIGVGWLMLRLRRWVDEPRTEVVLSLLTPFVAYWPPEHLGGSGVLATVAAGLYISWNGQRMISAATRLQGVFFWGFLIYLIEGLVFLITGLQARTLVDGVGAGPVWPLLEAAGTICAVVILARFVWMYPATYIPRWLSPTLRRTDPAPPWQWPFALAFTGVRGIVSLAAALAIPLTTDDGRPFPERGLILVLTFVVIVVTLVGQGLLLPTVMRRLGLARAGREERRADRLEELRARGQAIEAAIGRLERLAGEWHLAEEEVVGPLRARHRERLRHVPRSPDRDDSANRLTELDHQIELQLIAAERDHVNALARSGQLKDEARRRIERELDLREAHLANQRPEE
jgi:CPA1 family monovalent cation:H+ antiporter